VVELIEPCCLASFLFVVCCVWYPLHLLRGQLLQEDQRTGNTDWWQVHKCKHNDVPYTRHRRLLLMMDHEGVFCENLKLQLQRLSQCELWVCFGVGWKKWQWMNLKFQGLVVEVEFLQRELLVTHPHHNVEGIVQHNPYHGHVSRPYTLCNLELDQVL
jgi:hypothetical protein